MGAIGRHNVVLAYPPGMSKASAAAVAAKYGASFPSIRLVLVVGICGAVPSPARPDGPKQIVLGDVIISPSVVQYDLGRRHPEGFARQDAHLDSLGRPNSEKRSLLTKPSGLRG